MSVYPLLLWLISVGACQPTSLFQPSPSGPTLEVIVCPVVHTPVVPDPPDSPAVPQVPDDERLDGTIANPRLGRRT